jgi:hypothetical protein
VQRTNSQRCHAALRASTVNSTVALHPVTVTTAIVDRRNVLKTNDLLPGQTISVDHFACTAKGRLFTSAGKTKPDDMYSGGCIFVDHASGFVHIEHQQHMSSHETLKAKDSFEARCRDYGVIPQTYVTDNGGAFISADYDKHLRRFEQINRYAGAGAHHHNGVAERNIRTIMAVARTMMLHSAIHWPQVADTSLWPMAVTHAVYLHNHMPNVTTGLSPSDIFTKTRWEHRRFQDFHVWGAPVYVLEAALAGGVKLPRWQPRSTRMKLMGFSQKHANSVPSVLNPSTGFITAQYHVVFDDLFSTITAASDQLPDFNSPAWAKMFGESAYQYPMDPLDEAELEREEQEQNDDNTFHVNQQNRIAQAFERVLPATQLPIPPNPVAPTTTTPPAPDTTPTMTTSASPTRENRETQRIESPTIQQIQSAQSPTTPTSTPPTPPKLIDSTKLTITSPESPTRESTNIEPAPLSPMRILSTREQVVSVTHDDEMPHPEEPPAPDLPGSSTIEPTPPSLRRSTRARAPPIRLGYDGSQGRGYLSMIQVTPQAPSPTRWDWLYNDSGIKLSQLTSAPPHQSSDESIYSYKASTSDPDTLSFDQAMSIPDEMEKWKNCCSCRNSIS